MSYTPAADYALEVARGNVTGASAVTKYGRSTNVDSGIATDIWDRANATNDQDIWVAPTTARVHNIASSSTSDDGDPAGVGARTIRVFGLTSWDAAEVSEDITMNGTSNVATTNSYVIIHRMRVLTKGATNTNVGLITATAVTDNTITAQINAGNGSTLMAIYGVPSTQSAYMGRLYGNINRGSPASAEVDFSLLENPEPKAELTNFRVRHTFGIYTDGTSALTINYYVPKVFTGPCIIKLQGTGGANDIDASGGFDFFLVNN